MAATKKTTSTPAAKREVTVHFRFEKETPNTYRFTEEGTNRDNKGLIGTLYVQKAAFGDAGKPDKVTVTITF